MPAIAADAAADATHDATDAADAAVAAVFPTSAALPTGTMVVGTRLVCDRPSATHVHIVLVGVAHDVSDGQLSFNYDALTIEAEVPGTVVLDAARSNQVLKITGLGWSSSGSTSRGTAGCEGRTRTHMPLLCTPLPTCARLFEPYPAPRALRD